MTGLPSHCWFQGVPKLGWLAKFDFVSRSDLPVKEGFLAPLPQVKVVMMAVPLAATSHSCERPGFCILCTHIFTHIYIYYINIYIHIYMHRLDEIGDV